MVDAGIPLVGALDILGDQIENKTFGEIIMKVRNDVETGSSLSDAIAKHKKAFSPLFVNMVKAGESSGMLDVILDRLTTRRTCSNSECQEIYNIKSNPPAADGTCKKCGSPVIQRDAETEEAILNRLKTYNEKTSPLIGFYEGKGLLRNFISLSSKDTVEEIKKSLRV